MAQALDTMPNLPEREDHCVLFPKRGLGKASSFCQNTHCTWLPGQACIVQMAFAESLEVERKAKENWKLRGRTAPSPSLVRDVFHHKMEVGGDNSPLCTRPGPHLSQRLCWSPFSRQPTEDMGLWKQQPRGTSSTVWGRDPTWCWRGGGYPSGW